jgi:hypothetical protein
MFKKRSDFSRKAGSCQSYVICNTDASDTYMVSDIEVVPAKTITSKAGKSPCQFRNTYR